MGRLILPLLIVAAIPIARTTIPKHDFDYIRTIHAWYDSRGLFPARRDQLQSVPWEPPGRAMKKP